MSNDRKRGSYQVLHALMLKRASPVVDRLSPIIPAGYKKTLSGCQWAFWLSKDPRAKEMGDGGGGGGVGGAGDWMQAWAVWVLV